MSGASRRRWLGCRLGDLRPSRYAYQECDYDTQPPLDRAMLDGTFRWADAGSPQAGGPVAGRPVAGAPATAAGQPAPAAAQPRDGAPAPAAGTFAGPHRSELRRLTARLHRVGLGLPPDVVAFYTGHRTWHLLDDVSLTGCRTSFADGPEPSPRGDGAYLVPFLQDPQGCAVWHLYLGPAGAAFVVYEADVYALDAAEVPVTAAPRDLVWCSPSFEAFAYRYWLEGVLGRRLAAGDPFPLDERGQAYLDHFRPRPRRPPARHRRPGVRYLG
jgi:hypothetical protein